MKPLQFVVRVLATMEFLPVPLSDEGQWLDSSFVLPVASPSMFHVEWLWRSRNTELVVRENGARA